MRISDWSSDVCSSDLIEGDKSQLLLSGECQLVVELGHRASPGASTTMPGEAPLDARTVRASRLQPVSSSSHPEPATRRRQDADRDSQERILTPQHPEPATTRRPNDDRKIGRASGRERVCKYV